jgi:hypothetical protein
MDRFGESDRPLSPQERWIAGIFLAVVLGLFAAEIWHDYQPVKLSALLIIVFWIPLLALHECGHAVVAALLHWRVQKVVIGMGRLVATFPIRNTPVEIRLLPIEGFVRCAPQDLRFPRLKQIAIYFAGPGVELLVALGVVLLVGWHRLLTPTENYSLIAWQSLALAATAGAVLNLIPQAVRTPQGLIPNDGLGILLSFFLPEQHFAQMLSEKREEEDSNLRRVRIRPPGERPSTHCG